MKSAERKEAQQGFEKATGQAFKKTRWKVLTVQTKEHPSKPGMLITGELACIFPTGDIAFSKILKMQTWEPQSNLIQEVAIPEIYKTAKKIDIRREIIAATLYIEE